MAGIEKIALPFNTTMEIYKIHGTINEKLSVEDGAKELTRLIESSTGQSAIRVEDHGFTFDGVSSLHTDMKRSYCFQVSAVNPSSAIDYLKDIGVETVLSNLYYKPAGEPANNLEKRSEWFQNKAGKK